MFVWCVLGGRPPCGIRDAKVGSSNLSSGAMLIFRNVNIRAAMNDI